MSRLETGEAATGIKDQLSNMQLYQEEESTIIGRVQLVTIDNEVALKLYLQTIEYLEGLTSKERRIDAYKV